MHSTWLHCIVCRCSYGVDERGKHPYEVFASALFAGNAKICAWAQMQKGEHSSRVCRASVACALHSHRRSAVERPYPYGTDWSSRCNGGSDGWAERAAGRVVAGSTWSRSLCSQHKDRKGALQRAALAPIMQAHAHASKRALTRARAPAHLYPALMQMLERTPHHRLHRASQLIRCGIAGGRLAHSFALGC